MRATIAVVLALFLGGCTSVIEGLPDGFARSHLRNQASYGAITNREMETYLP